MDIIDRGPARSIAGFVNGPGDHVLYQPHAPELDADERRRAVAFIEKHSKDPGLVLAVLGLVEVEDANPMCPLCHARKGRDEYDPGRRSCRECLAKRRKGTAQ